MRRERSQSSDRGRPYVPRWDNPTGQLPGTGIPSGSDSGLHGTSRRRDSSVPERSRLRTSESGASAGESRPSLFDGLSSGFFPKAAAKGSFEKSVAIKDCHQSSAEVMAVFKDCNQTLPKVLLE